MNDLRCILIVDDQESDRRLAKRVLSKVWPDVAIVEACDGKAAIRLLERSEGVVPDIILLDINMPKMNGHEFLEAWFGENELDTPVVFILTSSSLQSDRERAWRFASVRSYLLKPITKKMAARFPELAA